MFLGKWQCYILNRELEIPWVFWKLIRRDVKPMIVAVGVGFLQDFRNILQPDTCQVCINQSSGLVIIRQQTHPVPVPTSATESTPSVGIDGWIRIFSVTFDRTLCCASSLEGSVTLFIRHLALFSICLWTPTALIPFCFYRKHICLENRSLDFAGFVCLMTG